MVTRLRLVCSAMGNSSATKLKLTFDIAKHLDININIYVYVFLVTQSFDQNKMLVSS